MNSRRGGGIIQKALLYWDCFPEDFGRFNSLTLLIFFSNLNTGSVTKSQNDIIKFEQMNLEDWLNKLPPLSFLLSSALWLFTSPLLYIAKRGHWRAFWQLRIHQKYRWKHFEIQSNRTSLWSHGSVCTLLIFAKPLRNQYIYFSKWDRCFMLSVSKYLKIHGCESTVFLMKALMTFIGAVRKSLQTREAIFLRTVFE